MTLATQRTIRPYIPYWLDYLNRRQGDETPHVDDRFFREGDAHGGTAVTPTGTASWTVANDVLSGVATGQVSQDANVLLWPMTSTVAPVTIEVAIRPMVSNANFAHSGLCFADGTAVTSSVAIAATNQISWEGKTGTIQNITTVAAPMPSTLTQVGRAHNYMRLIWASENTWKHQRSADGINWSLGTTTTFAFTLAPTHYGVALSAYGASSDQLAAFEYVRVADADLSL